MNRQMFDAMICVFLEQENPVLKIDENDGSIIPIDGYKGQIEADQGVSVTPSEDLP